MVLFLVFYWACITCKVAFITMQTSDMIHRMYKSEKRSWHHKWRKRTLTNPFLPPLTWSGIEQGFLYGFLPSLLDRKCNSRFFCLVLCNSQKYAWRFWPRDQTIKKSCLAVNLKKIDRHILKQSICQASPLAKKNPLISKY